MSGHQFWIGDRYNWSTDPRIRPMPAEAKQNWSGATSAALAWNEGFAACLRAMDAGQITPRSASWTVEFPDGVAPPEVFATAEHAHAFADTYTASVIERHGIEPAAAPVCSVYGMEDGADIHTGFTCTTYHRGLPPTKEKVAWEVVPS